MPIVSPARFEPPLPQINGHLQTVIPSLFRKVPDFSYDRRERVLTPDGDFIDLDWKISGHATRVAFLLHGLEGDSGRHYVTGTANMFSQNGWDVCAINYRSCSGEMNWQPRFYHHADTPDVDLVARHILQTGRYDKMVMIGFSLGGSLTLRYLGEQGEQADPRIVAGVAFSVPCDLSSCSRELEKPDKLFYNIKFYRSLKKKVLHKAELMPDKVSAALIRQHSIRTCRKFDEFYTAPLHGFASAEDFYQKASSRWFLDGIRRPVLLVNAQNDPFLPQECYPTQTASQSEWLHLEMPDMGGHVGFCIRRSPDTYAELRAVEFCTKYA